MSVATTVAEYRNFINGAWVASQSDHVVDNINPADTREVVGRVRLSTRADVRAALTAAAQAQRAWAATPAPQRASYLFAAQRILARRGAEVAEVMTREEGKTLGESRGEVQKSLNILEFMGGEGRRLGGMTRSSEMASTFCCTLRVPVGVVSLITPWNVPLAIPIWKIAPAIVAGNTCVLKPSTLTPGTAVLLMEIFAEAGLPAGVLNLVLGNGRDVGDELVTHAAVRAVSFTGSNEVGGQIYAQGAGRRLKVQCEMGGKNPIIVLDDADLDLAVEATLQGAFGSTGQRCTATSRAIVDVAVADQFVTRLTQGAEAIVLGNGMDARVGTGPCVDANQMQKVLDYIAIGRQEGAVLVAGGERARAGDLQHGYFVKPTVFDRVTGAMRIAREEIFGPVVAVTRVNGFDAALEAANDVAYGLSSSLYTRDVGRVFRYVDRLETGMMHVNSSTVGGETHLPFGGLKATGLGGREMNEAAFEFYTEQKALYIDYTGQKREASFY